MNKRYTPLLLVAYKRVDVLKHSLSALQKCVGLNDRLVFAYLDGARSSVDETGIAEVYKMFLMFKETVCPQLRIVRREKNLGCRGNITQAISELINQFGRLIIVEDDIVVSRYFLQYMDEALDVYRDDKRIWGINAWRNRFAKVPDSYTKDVYLHQRNMCWGWGTWADRWNAVDFDMEYWPIFKKDPRKITQLNSVSPFLFDMLESQYIGNLKTWDVQCSLHIVNEDMYCIEPRYCMTRNCGCEGGHGAEHFTSADSAIATQPFYNFMPRLETDLRPNEEMEKNLGLSDFNPSIMIRCWRKFLREFWRLGFAADEPRDVKR